MSFSVIFIEIAVLLAGFLSSGIMLLICEEEYKCLRKL